MRKMLDKKEIEKIIDEHGGEPEAYLKSANVNGNTLTLTNKDNTTVVFTPEGGSVDIDNKTIIENQSDELETAIGGYKTEESTPGQSKVFIDNDVNIGYQSTSEPTFSYTGNLIALKNAMNLAEWATVRQNGGMFTADGGYNCIVKCNGETILDLEDINIGYNNNGASVDGDNTAILINAAVGANRVSLNNVSTDVIRIKVYPTTSAYTFAETDVVTFYLYGPDPEAPAVTVVTYHPLDGRYLPIDGASITLNGSNQLQGFSGDYVDLTNKPTLFSGDYNDLTNKPSIPDAVSGVNDGTNWTSLTIGSDTYGIGGGSSGGDAYLAGNQVFTGQNTFSNAAGLTVRSAESGSANGIINFGRGAPSLTNRNQIIGEPGNDSSSSFQFKLNNANTGWTIQTYKMTKAAFEYINARADLGSATNPWTNVYLSGSLTDGTDSASLADLVALIAYAKSQGWIQ